MEEMAIFRGTGICKKRTWNAAKVYHCTTNLGTILMTVYPAVL